jgi:hypothetical protein
MIKANNKIAANWIKISTNLQSQLIASEEDKIKLSAENERLREAATNLLSALHEYRTFKPDEERDGWEDERMRIFETLNMTEAELIAALQPKEGNQ